MNNLFNRINVSKFGIIEKTIKEDDKNLSNNILCHDVSYNLLNIFYSDDELNNCYLPNIFYPDDELNNCYLPDISIYPVD